MKIILMKNLNSAGWLEDNDSNAVLKEVVDRNIPVDIYLEETELDVLA